MWARIASELHFSFDINSIEAKNTNYVQYHFEFLKGFLVEGYLLGANITTSNVVFDRDVYTQRNRN